MVNILKTLFVMYKGRKSSIETNTNEK